MKIVKRNLTVRVQELLTQFPIVALVGARQAGKTELAKTVGQGWKYFDLENPKDLNRIQIDPDVFFAENPDSVILDEAQEFPELFKVLRGVVDRDRQKKGRFLISGSSSPQLLKNISESLAGRVATVEVGTLKANEYYEKPLSPIYSLWNCGKKNFEAEIKQLTPQLSRDEMKQFWFQGGYPEPTLTSDPRFYNEWMQEYQKTYIERDIRKLFSRINIQKYRRFISLLADLSGTIVNRSELATLLDISQPTATQYLTIADGTFIWRSIPSFSRPRNKSLVKMPKGHVRDSGLLHFLTMTPDLETLLSRSQFGRSFEAFVIEEILKGLTDIGLTSWNYSYYRTRSRAEVDLIIEDSRLGVIPIEIKHSSQVDSRDLTNLNHFISEYQSPFGLLVNQSTEVLQLNEKVIQVPVGML